MIGRRSGQRAQLEAEPFGSLRGTPHVFTADDGVELYVEVDELKRSRRPAPPKRRLRRKPPLPPEDLTLIFAHGYGLNMDCWHFERRDLAGIGTMVFYDQRSHGRSGRSPKENVSIDQLGRDLLRDPRGVRADRAGDPDRALDGRHVDHGAGRAAPGDLRRPDHRRRPVLDQRRWPRRGPDRAPGQGGHAGYGRSRRRRSPRWRGSPMWSSAAARPGRTSAIC